MEIVPAIDIRGGKCVNLYQGDYGRETVFSEDPVAVANTWVEHGARRLHVVDLDGARAGAPANLDLAAEIAATVEVPVQLGGGIRTVDTARLALSRGLARVVVGTAAIAEPHLVEEMSGELGGEAVLVSVDARDGYAMAHGWTQRSRVRVSELVKRLARMGVRRLVYTDIARVGTLTQPNFQAIKELAGQTELGLLVAGGIGTIDDLRRLSELRVEGAIVGRAVYTNDIDLREAIAALTSPGNSHGWEIAHAGEV